MMKESTKVPEPILPVKFLTVKEFAASLSHADVSQLMHSADCFPVALDLQDPADGLQDKQAEYYKDKNGNSAKFH